jgi:hypothetical protein
MDSHAKESKGGKSKNSQFDNLLVGILFVICNQLPFVKINSWETVYSTTNVLKHMFS